MGIAMTKAKRLGQWIGWTNILIGTAMTMAFIVSYIGLKFLLTPVNLFFGWAYPVLQSAVRIALGIWLWLQVSTSRNYKWCPKFNRE